MDILEAYKETLDAAQDLRQYGIQVEITPSQSDTERTDDSLPLDRWVDITFRFKTKAQAEMVKRRADELGWHGIGFDTSGTKGEREWQIDWSFRVNPVPDAEWQARREEVEDIIDEPDEGMSGPRE